MYNLTAKQGATASLKIKWTWQKNEKNWGLQSLKNPDSADCNAKCSFNIQLVILSKFEKHTMIKIISIISSRLYLDMKSLLFIVLTILIWFASKKLLISPVSLAKFKASSNIWLRSEFVKSSFSSDHYQSISFNSYVLCMHNQKIYWIN